MTKSSGLSHLTPVKSSGASEGTYLESHDREEKQGMWIHTKVGKKKWELGGSSNCFGLLTESVVTG